MFSFGSFFLRFEKTLRKVDTLLLRFLAEMLVGFYTAKGSTLLDLVEYLYKSKNIIDKFYFELSRENYKFKLMQLLSESLLCVQPWGGVTRAKDGYLIVTKMGDILCYHVFNRDVFLNCLLNNTRFGISVNGEVPILEIEVIDGRVYTNLKLHIRFI